MAINFEQLAQSMGFTGAAADQLARSLQAASNSADRSANALNAEASAVARATQQSRTFGDQLANIADTLLSFSGQILSTADGMASSNTVFTQITPLVTKATSIISDMAKAGGELAGIVGGLIGNVPGGAIGAIAGKIFGGVAAELATLAGEIFNQYLQQGEKVMGAFNSLSSVGVTFGGSLQEMQKIIKNTGMPLEMLAKVAQSNAENLALLGGGVSGALESVAKAARNDLGPQLVTLYGGFANLSDELVDYMAMERRRGVDQDLLSDNNIESTKAYLYQLKEISALTGKSSKQLKQEIEQRSRNAATQGMLSKMSDTQRKQYDAAMLKVPDAVKGPLQDAFLAFSRGMEPVSTEFLQLQAAAPEAAESIRRMALAANKGPDEFNRVMDQESKNLTVSAGKLTEQMGDLFYLQQAGRLSSSLVDTLNKVITDINSNAVRLKTMGEDSEKFAAETKKLAETATTFSKSVEGIYDSQAKLAVTLNSLILGADGYTSKFDSFATVAIAATNTINTFVSNFDLLISKILGFKEEEKRDTTVGNIQQSNSQFGYNMELESQQQIRRAQTMSDSIKNELTSEENKSSPDRIKIENLKTQLQQQEEQIKRFEEQIKNARKPSEQNTDVPSSGVSTDLPSPLTGGGIDNDRTTSLGNSYTDSKTVALMIERAMEKNQVVLSKLAESVTSQGEQIRRAVDKMA